MKTISFLLTIFALLGLPFETLVRAQVHVRGYTKKDGTYVAPHYRSAPDGNFHNNWSTKGNVNPYTGSAGTRVTPPNYSYGGSSTLGNFGTGNPAAGMNRTPGYSPLPNATIGNPAGLPMQHNIQPSTTYNIPANVPVATPAPRPRANAPKITKPRRPNSATRPGAQQIMQGQQFILNGLIQEGISKSIEDENNASEMWARDHNVEPPPAMRNPFRQTARPDQRNRPITSKNAAVSSVRVINGERSSYSIPTQSETYEEKLRALGVTNSLTGKTYNELSLIESRAKTAAKLKKRGVEVDWQTKSMRELNEMLTRAEERANSRR